MTTKSEKENNRKEFYGNFYDPTGDFKKVPRAFCYNISRGLITVSQIETPAEWYTNEKTINAILLLAYCWNLDVQKADKLKRKGIIELLKKTKEDLRKLNTRTILNFNKKDEALIASIYKSFKTALGQTGASRVLSLLNPKLFVMWDTKIRNNLRKELISGIDNGKDPKHYLRFLNEIKSIIRDYNLVEKIDKSEEIAKKIDEFHYLKFEIKDIE